MAESISCSSASHAVPIVGPGLVSVPPGPSAETPTIDQIIQCSPIGMAVVDHDGIWRTANPACCTLHGFTQQQMIGQPFTLVFPLAQRERMLRLHQEFLAGRGEFRGEWDVVRRDGTVLNVISESVRILGDDGCARRLVYVVDITQRKNMERALQSSRHFLQSVLDGLGAHVCVLDEAGVIVRVNRAWHEFAIANGAAADAIYEGVAYPGLSDPAPHGLAPGGGGPGPFARLLREVLAGHSQSFQFEYECHSPTQKRWFVANVSRIAGSVPPRIVIAHDNITELKRAQETVRQSEALLLDLTASIPGAVFRLVVQASGPSQFVYVSPGVEALFGVTPAAVCASADSLWSCILPEDRPGHDACIRGAIAQGRTWEHEYRIVSMDGEVKWVHARAQPRAGEGGRQIWTGVLTEVTDRKRMEAVLQASEETYRTLFETVPQGVVYHDTSGRITSANPAALRILGLTLEQVLGAHSIDSRWRSLREDGSDMPGEEHPAMRALSTGHAVNDVVMGVSVPDRGHRWIRVSATPVFKAGRVKHVYASFEDITERVQLSHELQRQASTDYLTGAANRRSLVERLHVEFQRIGRHSRVRCSVLSIDLDHFKRVNDTWGHGAGDAVLVQVAALMRQETRQVDVVARCGGEEFVILLPDTGHEDALAKAERLRQRIEEAETLHGGHPIRVTISIGVSAITPSDPQAEAVLARADAALYEAKNAGRNVVMFAQTRT